MTDKPSAGRTPSVSSKRKSLLSELGIQPSGATTTETPKPRTTTPPTATRRASTSVKPSSPSVSRTRPTSTTASTTKGAPTPIKVVDRNTVVKPTNVSSPTSPSPTTAKRRSIVPTSSSQRSSTISPLARRASIQSPNSSSSVAANKRVSSPAGLESLQEVQTMKEQLTKQEVQLQEKEKEIEKLKQAELTLKSEKEKMILEFNQLKQEKEQIMSNNQEGDNKAEQEAAAAVAAEQQKEQDEIKQRLLQKESTENKAKMEKMEKLLESQEQKSRLDLQSLTTDYDHQIAKLRQTYENQHQIDLDKVEKEKKDYIQQLIQEQTMHENFKKEQESLLKELKSQIVLLEEQQTSSHARKIENDLVIANAALEELKRQSLQATENLERRYRDEIRQLQSGSDDTAQAWLEKTRSAQQQVDQLHDELLKKESAHKQALEQLTEQHRLEIENLTETCETKETEIEAQSSQIEDLLYQVETLQNSLEAATVRLEHTAKSSPTTSSTRDEINNSSDLTSQQHVPIKNIHQECLDRVDAKQKELQDIKTRMKEIKETHESQLNRLGQEKASAIAELRKTILDLEQRLAANTPPTTPTIGKNMIDEERLISIAEQHRKEINTMHQQYQVVVDTKDRELEDYAYRLKAIVAAKQKEVEKIQNETNATIDKYERDIEGYESKIIEYEKESVKLQDRITHWEQLSRNNEALVQDMKKECASHSDENAQLVRLVNQLQSEIHS